MESATQEAVRLVVWDLDETFWRGTISEEGITYRRDTHDIVIELAKRGIVSSICSKNDLTVVREVLEREGIWEYFIFPSVNWDAKGPRLARLVEDVQLRAPTIMFIDDNSMNLAEAQHYVPGLQVASHVFIEGMLASPLFRGKADPEMSRLKRYKLLERRKQDEALSGGDNTAFLRESDIVVTIEHDLDPRIDRAIELINRTNQLNFTSNRLPEEPEAARAALREELSHYQVQAGLIHVQDRYGDYGYCGLYVLKNNPLRVDLRYFCFSCRTMNMGIETWLYQRIGKPLTRVKNAKLAELAKDDRVIDWIRLRRPEEAAAAGPERQQQLDYVFARGGCDLRALTHYFHMIADDVRVEVNTVEDALPIPLHHSLFARYAITGIPPKAKRAFKRLGYDEVYFKSLMTQPPTGRSVWVLSFWAEPSYAIYRHNETGLFVPVSARDYKTYLRDIALADPAEFPADAKIIAAVREEFSFVGMIDETLFQENLRMVLDHKPAGTKAFIILLPELFLNNDNVLTVNTRKRKINQWTIPVAHAYPDVDLLNMNDYASDHERTSNPNHFDRMVYYKVFQQIMKRVEQPSLESAAD